MTSALHQTLLRIRESDDIRAALDIELEWLETNSPDNVLEMPDAEALTHRKACTVRRWAAEHKLGRKVGGKRWILFRDRFEAFVARGSQ